MKFSYIKMEWEDSWKRDMYCDSCGFTSDDVVDAWLHEFYHGILHFLFKRKKHETIEYW